MRNWKLTLAVAALTAPVGSLNAVSAADDAAVATIAQAPQGTTIVVERNGQSDCCWVFWMGRWRCVPC